MDKANESIKKYRQDVLADFLNNVLEIEKEESVKSAVEIEKVLSEDVIVKLVHFADCLLQCSVNSKCSKESKCDSCCGNCKCEE